MRPFIKITDLAGAPSWIAVDAIVTIQDRSLIDDTPRCLITFTVGRKGSYTYAKETAAEVWEQVCRLQAGWTRVEDEAVASPFKAEDFAKAALIPIQKEG